MACVDESRIEELERRLHNEQMRVSDLRIQLDQRLKRIQQLQTSAGPGHTLTAELHRVRSERDQALLTINDLLNTKTYRYTRVARNLYSRIRSGRGVRPA